MLDVGRELAEAIYFLQYTLAQILWAIDRALLSVAVIAENVNAWLTANVGYFVELLTNALAGPMGALFIFALTLLGVWFLMNNVLPTKRPVDPQKLLVYGFMTFFFFATPTLVIDMLEGLRQAATAGVQQALLDEAEGDLFGSDLGGTDTGLPAAIPDVYPAGDGLIGSFDLVAYFLAMGNLTELDNTEFPVLFTATYFPFGDPSAIDLTDEADREAARGLAADGIERLFFALIAVPTAIADHFLRLSLTGAALLLYAGVPFAMMLAFFVYTESFIGAYLRQFINLLIETFLSVIIASIVIGMLAVAAQQGVGVYIGAGLIACVVLSWRIKGALKLAMSGLHLFGGGVLTGGATGTDLANMGRNVALAGAGLGLAAVTGGSSLALAGLLKADARADGAYLGTDPEKSDNRVQQLEVLAGYGMGRSRRVRDLIETAHEVRTFSRNFHDGGVERHDPDLLDYLRVGSSMSNFGSSPWVATRLSSSLRDAYGQVGGLSGDVPDGRRPRWRNSVGEVTTAPTNDSSSPEDGWAQTVPSTPTAAAVHTSTGSLPIPATTAPAIQLAPMTAARHAGLLGLADNLAGADAGQAQRILVQMVGADNAQLVATAVADHGAAAVTAAITAILDQMSAAQAAGQTPQEILATFQDGTSLSDSPLSPPQLAALTDTVLQPRRAVSQIELLAQVGEILAAGGGNDRDLAAQLGSPTHFGPQTGAIRALLEGVATLQLTAAQVREMAAALRDGENAADYLRRQGYAPDIGHAFARDLAGIGTGVWLPQTVSKREEA
ncbi:MAG: hypothetical protein H7A05_11425 [Pseudomonadales bacterium]|nr:hypothetical protein [Pseudomonadales bacterium]